MQMDITGVKDQTSTTFSDNVTLPIHGWFRYSAGYSAKWVHQVLREQRNLGRSRVIDPFVGSGTTILEAENCNMESVGIESHPFVYRVAQAKLAWDIDPDYLKECARELVIAAQEMESNNLDYPEIILRCYTPESLRKLDSLRRVIEGLDFTSNAGRLLWVALASILRECSPAGTANWQYLLPNKKKAKVIEPYQAYERKILQMCRDIENKQKLAITHKAQIINADCRERIPLDDHWADLLITSPPYPNNYDYADATRLEMTFFKEIQGWSDLQDTVRPYLVRACTQHVASLSRETDQILNNPLLSPIAEEIWDVCKELEKVRMSKGGKKPYHTMIATYYLDLAKVWHNLRRVMRDGSLTCYVIGDSAPYGVYAPADEWLGKLAISAGFKTYSFEKTRDRNVKWKNRKHTVPLKEGRLWVQG